MFRQIMLALQPWKNPAGNKQARRLRRVGVVGWTGIAGALLMKFQHPIGLGRPRHKNR